MFRIISLFIKLDIQITAFADCQIAYRGFNGKIRCYNLC